MGSEGRIRYHQVNCHGLVVDDREKKGVLLGGKVEGRVYVPDIIRGRVQQDVRVSVPCHNNGGMELPLCTQY